MGLDNLFCPHGKTGTLSASQIDAAIEKEEHLSAVYSHQKLSSPQIDAAIKKGKYLYSLIRYNTLSSDQILVLMEDDENLEDIYRTQKLTPELVVKALEKSLNQPGQRWQLFARQKLSPQQIDKALEVAYYFEDYDALYRGRKITAAQIDAAIRQGTKLNLSVLYETQKLTTKQIDDAITRGDELHTLYEHQELSQPQLIHALDVGKYSDVLFSYQKRLSPRVIQYAIDEEVALEFLYSSPRTSAVQKTEILKKLGVSVPKDLQKSKLWSRVSPIIVMDAIKQFNESVDSKMKDSPIARLVGTYEVADIHNAWKDITDFLSTKSMSTKQGDYKYAYYTGKDNREKQIKIGRVIKDESELTKQYSKIQQFGSPDAIKLEVKISIDPEHIAMKSTGQTWTSCETIGAMCGIGEECGWCDDIIANNLIAFIKYKDKDDWLGRCIIRWCVREEDSKPDAVIEKYYGKPKYKDVLVNNLITILRKTGFTGILGDNICMSPYTYSGYVDSGRQMNGKIRYEIGDRPINK